MILTYISLCIFLALLGLGFYKKKGIPDCISRIYYYIGNWFTLLLGGASFTLMPHIITVTPESFMFLAFFICAALMFVAFAPRYLDDTEYKTHYYSAIASSSSAILWSIFMQPYALFCLLIGLIGSLLNKENYLFWCELSFFTMIYLILILI